MLAVINFPRDPSPHSGIMPTKAINCQVVKETSLRMTLPISRPYGSSELPS